MALGTLRLYRTVKYRAQTPILFCAGTALIVLGFSCAGSPAGFGQSNRSREASTRPKDPDPQELIQQGFKLHQQGRFAEAIPILEQARHFSPDDYFANLLLGIDLLRSGKATQAMPRLKQASLARPGEEFPLDYLAEAEASLGQYDLASETYRRALLRGHDSEEATEAWAGFALERFRRIGETLRSSNQGLEAVRRIQAAAGNSPVSPSEATKCAVSIPALERRLSEKPQKSTQFDVDVRYRLSLCYATVAGEASNRLQSAEQDQAGVYRLRGDVLLRLKGDAGAAQAQYDKAVALEPRNPVLLERLAEAQLSDGNPEAARASAKGALAIDPHQRDALRTLAALAMNDRDYDQALPLLRQLSIEAPGDPAVAVELGRVLAQTGEYAEALKWLAPVLAAGYPDEKGASYALLARVLHKLGREQEAVTAEAESRRLSDVYQAHSHAGEISQQPSSQLIPNGTGRGEPGPHEN